MKPRYAAHIFLSIILAISASSQERVSKPFSYAGYSQAEYKGVGVQSAFVPMSDGAKLAVDVYTPADGPAQSSFPVIVEYLPYQRSRVNPATGEIEDSRKDADCKLFVSHGYVFVRADMRGTGASTGWMIDFMPRLCDDGKELVDWIAAQPWCDGNVGMKGASYLGWSQTATASRMPKALKCIIPTVIPLDGFSGEVYPGGIYLQGFMAGFSEYMALITRNCFVPDGGIRPTKPVVDEDGDGDLADEIPEYDPATGSFLTNGEPKYRDGVLRKNIYYEATKEHTRNFDYNSWASKANFLDSPIADGLDMYVLSPGGHVPGVMKSKIPIYNIGAWFDGFARGTFELYCTMRESNPSKLLITVGYHEPEQGPFWKYLGEDRDSIPARYWAEHLRFFDHYLKGIDNGIDKEPPICIYVMHGGGWRFENEWPLARQVITPFYFAEGHGLVSKAGSDWSDDYTIDLTHSSTYTESKGNRWLGIGVQWPDAPPVRTEKDKQCLTYTSVPLDNDTEVTGHPIVHINASSTAPDADFFVYLEDVDERGEALLVTEGQLRAGFAGLHDNNRMILRGTTGIDVKPELPWHGFEKADYNPQVFANNAVVELVVDLFPTSWVFRKGHRIRVSIAGADYPTFTLNPAQSPKNDPSAPDNISTAIAVHRGGAKPSRIELPVIPGKAK
ncbi:MAG: CocE/NonD family hydrolase [Candidatus Hydrogenedentes bacterium]|nr:CocE/NonD family hydrolase [Candidatus Hydrogenedentota bacterium]